MIALDVFIAKKVFRSTRSFSLIASRMGSAM